MKPRYAADFEAELIRFPGKGGWTFAPVPEQFASQATHGWGRTLLPVPKKVRDTKGRGDTVRIRIEFNALYPTVCRWRSRRASREGAGQSSLSPAGG